MDEQESDQISDNQHVTFEYKAQMYKIVIPIFLIISGFAVIANALVIIALRMTKVRNATVTLIMSLTVSDIWTSSIVALSLLYNSYLPIVKGTYPDPCLSLTLEMLRTGGLITGTLHLLLISIHHYISIVKPYTDKHKLRKTALILCLIAWLSPLIILFSLACFLPGQGYHDDCTNVEFYHNRLFRLSVSIFLVIIFIFIIFCYTRLLMLLRNQASHWRNSRSTQKRVSRENRTLWTTILICSSFFIGWAPATIHFTITCDTCELLRQQQFRVLFLFSCIQLSFILGKSLMNPLIYSLRIPEVDAELHELLHKYYYPIKRTICFEKNKGLEKTSSIKRINPSERMLERPSSTDEQSKIMINDESPLRVSISQNATFVSNSLFKTNDTETEYL